MLLCNDLTRPHAAEPGPNYKPLFKSGLRLESEIGAVRILTSSCRRHGIQQQYRGTARWRRGVVWGGGERAPDQGDDLGKSFQGWRWWCATSVPGMVLAKPAYPSQAGWICAWGHHGHRHPSTRHHLDMRRQRGLMVRAGKRSSVTNSEGGLGAYPLGGTGLPRVLRSHPPTTFPHPCSREDNQQQSGCEVSHDWHSSSIAVGDYKDWPQSQLKHQRGMRQEVGLERYPLSPGVAYACPPTTQPCWQTHVAKGEHIHATVCQHA